MYIIIKQVNIEISKKKNLLLFFRNFSKHLVKMIIIFYNINIRMFINTARNNVSLFTVNYFNESGFNLIFFKMLWSKRGLHERRLEIYRKVPSAEDSVGGYSKE